MTRIHDLIVRETLCYLHLNKAKSVAKSSCQVDLRDGTRARDRKMNPENDNPQ